MADYVNVTFPAPTIVNDTNAKDYVLSTIVVNETPAPPPPPTFIVGGMRGFTIIHP